MLAYHSSNPESCANEVGKVWKAVWGYLDSDDAQTRKAAIKSIDCLCRCFTPSMVSSAIDDGEGKSTLRKAVAQVDKAIDSLAYARAVPEVLAVVSSMTMNLSYRPQGRGSPTAAESLLLPLIVKVGEMRTSKGFEHKEKADAMLATAMQTLGPEDLLKILPLNLEPIDKWVDSDHREHSLTGIRQAGREPRAYLLPLLSQPHPSSLKHFVSYFVPLSERLFDLRQKAETEGRQSEAKVWSVLVAQIWTGLAAYCLGSPDLKEVLYSLLILEHRLTTLKSLTPAFSQLLSNLLYTQSELRPSVLKAFKVMIESNIALASPAKEKNELLNATPNISPEEAAANIENLRTQAESWLAVFFNVFSSVKPGSRGMVAEVIKAWASIMNPQVSGVFGQT